MATLRENLRRAIRERDERNLLRLVAKLSLLYGYDAEDVYRAAREASGIGRGEWEHLVLDAEQEVHGG